MSDQAQPRRWTASTVIVLIVMVVFAEHLIFNFALPLVCQMAVGAVLGVVLLIGVIVVCSLGYCMVAGVGHALKTKK